jgi:hypothetical protein
MIQPGALQFRFHFPLLMVPCQLAEHQFTTHCVQEREARYRPPYQRAQSFSTIARFRQFCAELHPSTHRSPDKCLIGNVDLPHQRSAARFASQQIGMRDFRLGSFASNVVRALQRRMSVGPRKRQLATNMRHVVEGQSATTLGVRLFNHLVGKDEQLVRNG